MDKISCIIPAYNEAKRISEVLSVVLKHELINEIIVVNDGSTDNTLEVVKKFKNIKIINYKKNMGKSHAVYMAMKKAKNNLFLLLDSDLIGLNKENLTSLIMPVLNGNADLSISLRKNAPKIFRLIGLDFISGERVIPRSLVSNYSHMLKLSGFELEVFLNKHIINKNLRIKVVRWDNVISPYPNSKFGFVKGTYRFLNMCKQIFKSIGIFGFFSQIFKMLSLIV